MHVETNAHLFWECWYVLDLWSKIQNILLTSAFEIQLNYFKVSFGALPYVHYENKPIQIYWKFYHQKMKKKIR